MAKTKQAKNKKPTKKKETETQEEEMASEKVSGKSLVIVESPGKVKTISKFLGKDFVVRASIGHVRDLPEKGLGVDVKNNFEPTYAVLEDKVKVVKELQDLAKKSEKIYLAQDPDREGEAIAWHLYELLASPKKTKRIICNEITKDAIKEAIKHPREIDRDLVFAQQARRILDRLVGYKISPLLWRKIGGRSAGRVQSVALRLVIERENEIRSFIQEEYWSIHAQLEKDKISFLSTLYKWDGKTISSPKGKESKSSIILKSKEEVDEIVKHVKKESFTVSNIENKETSRNPQPPFITSTLQRTCASYLGYSVKKIMKLAQELYEGVDIGEEGPTGLISYMRTDSTRISNEAQDEAKNYILEKYGAKYYPPSPRVFSTKKKNVQDAHEAIRPTNVSRSPDKIKKYLNPDQYKVYKVIWERFLASQMSTAKFLVNTIDIEAGKALFRVSATSVLFDGFLKAFEGTEDEVIEEDEAIEEDKELSELKEKENIVKLPEFKVKDKVHLKELDPKQHFTEPPPRYSEAGLVKKLEELGIGRPSTYASTISTIVDRKYAQKIDRKTLQPTILGERVTQLLLNHFPTYLDYNFTAKMENNLDDIEEAKQKWDNMITEFYDGFSDTLKKAQENLKTEEIKTEHKCPKCGNTMVMKGGRFGPFLGCASYPDCKTVLNLTKEGELLPPARESKENCPKCKSIMLIKFGPYGEYLQCKDDNCKHRSTLIKPVGVKCPKEGCTGEIIEKRSRKGKIFYGCSSWSKTKCDSAFWAKPINEECPECSSLLTFKQTSKQNMISCSNIKNCKHKREATEEETTKYTSPIEAAAMIS